MRGGSNQVERKMRKVGVIFVAFAFIPGMIGAAGAYPIDGLIGAYFFNGSAADSSGNGNDGFVNGAETSFDRFGNANSAYRFDGIDDFIRIESSSTNLSFDELTISVWAKVNGMPLEVGGIVTRWNQNHTFGDYYALVHDGFYELGTIIESSHEHYHIEKAPPLVAAR